MNNEKIGFDVEQGAVVGTHSLYARIHQFEKVVVSHYQITSAIVVFVSLALISGCVTSNIVQKKVLLASAISELIGTERSKPIVLKLSAQKDIYCQSVETFRVISSDDVLNVFDGMVFPNISRRIVNTEKVYAAYARAGSLAVCSKTNYTADGARFYDYVNLIFDEENHLLLIDDRIRKD